MKDKNQNALWEKFQRTGSVIDYLKYKKVKGRKEARSEGDNKK